MRFQNQSYYYLKCKKYHIIIISVIIYVQFFLISQFY